MIWYGPVLAVEHDDASHVVTVWAGDDAMRLDLSAMDDDASDERIARLRRMLGVVAPRVDPANCRMAVVRG